MNSIYEDNVRYKQHVAHYIYSIKRLGVEQPFMCIVAITFIWSSSDVIQAFFFLTQQAYKIHYLKKERLK